MSCSPTPQQWFAVGPRFDHRENATPVEALFSWTSHGHRNSWRAKQMTVTNGGDNSPLLWTRSETIQILPPGLLATDHCLPFHDFPPQDRPR